MIDSPKPASKLDLCLAKLAEQSLYVHANTDEITVPKILDMFAYAKLKDITGYSGHNFSNSPLKLFGENIEWVDEHFQKANDDEPAHEDPAHLRWYLNPIFAYAAIVDNAVEYRYTKNGDSTYYGCPVTKDDTEIAEINGIFNMWYQYLNLPAALDEIQKQAPKVSRKNKLKLIKNYLKTESDEDFEILTVEEDIGFWVDWREEDENIIEYCEDIIKTKKLSAELIETDNDIGFEIIITYKDSKHKIPYLGEGSDRDTTIITLNEVLKPDFEIRFCVASDGSDTLAFLPLKSSQWVKLENEFGAEHVAKHFTEITEESIFFG